MKYYIEIESIMTNKTFFGIIKGYIKNKKDLTIISDIVINDEGRIIKCRDNVNKLFTSHNNDCTATAEIQPSPKSPDGDFVQS